MHVGQSPVDSVVAEREAVMDDTEQVQDRGMEVIAEGLVLGSHPASGVALAERASLLDALTESDRIGLVQWEQELHESSAQSSTKSWFRCGIDWAAVRSGHDMRRGNARGANAI